MWELWMETIDKSKSVDDSQNALRHYYVIYMPFECRLMPTDHLNPIMPIKSTQKNKKKSAKGSIIFMTHYNNECVLQFAIKRRIFGSNSMSFSISVIIFLSWCHHALTHRWVILKLLRKKIDTHIPHIGTLIWFFKTVMTSPEQLLML